MGQTHGIENQVKTLNALTEYCPPSTAAFAEIHHLRLRFKTVYERSGLKAYFDKPVMIKVKLQLSSDSSKEKWYLEEAKFNEAAQLLIISQAELKPTDGRECEICNVGCIERRYPGCGVRATQHGFCSACIRSWMAEHDTCPFCRRENSGTADQRQDRLMLSVSLATGANVRKALSIICHRC